MTLDKRDVELERNVIDILTFQMGETNIKIEHGNNSEVPWFRLRRHYRGSDYKTSIVSRKKQISLLNGFISITQERIHFVLFRQPESYEINK